MGADGRTFSVGELASLAGVTVRTLHHYDETGLLRPSHRTLAGYRRYTGDDLDRLQSVLVYRALGFGLREIAHLLDDPGYDRRTALLRQRELLAARIDELRAVARLVDRTLTMMEGAQPMSETDMFAGLGPAERNEAEFGTEVRDRWGDTDAYTESTRRTADYTEQDWAAIRSESESIEAGLADLADAGVPADDPQTMALAERHRRHIDRWFYPCSHEMHAGLAEMYVADDRFARHYEQRREGLAAYVRDAVLANARHAMP